MTQPFVMRDHIRQVVAEAAAVDLSVPTRRHRLPADPRVPVVISVVKNEQDRMAEFFGHYRRLGVERFVIIDNGSTDGTAEFCAAQPDADLHVVTRKFVWPQKQGWITRAIAENGLDRWYVYVDADEHLVFDGMHEHGLRDLAAYAERLGQRRVRGMLIDMYAPGRLTEYAMETGQSLADAYPLFDSDSYVEHMYSEMISRKGGPRRRVLNGGDAGFNPEMTKYPLFKPRAGEIMCNPHHLFPYPDNFNTKCVTGLLHYKFLPGFTARVNEAIRSGAYWNGSIEYQRYLATLKAAPETTLFYEGSRTYASPADLIHYKLIDRLAWGEKALASQPAEARWHRMRSDRLERFA